LPPAVHRMQISSGDDTSEAVVMVCQYAAPLP
jgi:hypothetical protein